MNTSAPSASPAMDNMFNQLSLKKLNFLLRPRIPKIIAKLENSNVGIPVVDAINIDINTQLNDTTPCHIGALLVGLIVLLD